MCTVVHGEPRSIAAEFRPERVRRSGIFRDARLVKRLLPPPPVNGTATSGSNRVGRSSIGVMMFTVIMLSTGV